MVDDGAAAVAVSVDAGVAAAEQLTATKWLGC